MAGLNVRAVAVVAAMFGAHAASAAVIPRDVLKSYFQRGDRPTEAQFSVMSPDGEPGLGLPADFLFTRAPGGAGGGHLLAGLAGGTSVLGDGSGRIRRMGIGDTTPTSPLGYEGQASLADWSPGERAFVAFRFLDSAGLVHYGYWDLSIDPPLPGETLFALTVHGWAFETEADTALEIRPIPAPGVAGMFLAAGMLTVRRRR